MPLGKKILDIHCGTVPDTDPDLSYLKDESRYKGESPEDIAKYIEQDRKWLIDYDENRWGMVGVRCEAKLDVAGTIQTIHSGGLWGIEDDSERGYIEDVEQEEFGELATQLKELGFTDAQINEHRPVKGAGKKKRVKG